MPCQNGAFHSGRHVRYVPQRQRLVEILQLLVVRDLPLDHRDEFPGQIAGFFDGLAATLEADSAGLEPLSAQIENLDNLNLPQPELSWRYGIMAGLSTRSYKSYYDIAWDNDKIAEGYFHGMAHDRADVLPGPMSEEMLRQILFRLTASADTTAIHQ